jgi:propionyl-CoA synthetase
MREAGARQIGPVAAFKLAVVVDRLPKTRSGKILRGTMVKIADGESYKMPATIDDPAILDEIPRSSSPWRRWTARPCA